MENGEKIRFSFLTLSCSRRKTKMIVHFRSRFESKNRCPWNPIRCRRENWVFPTFGKWGQQSEEVVHRSPVLQSRPKRWIDLTKISTFSGWKNQPEIRQYLKRQPPVRGGKIGAKKANDKPGRKGSDHVFRHNNGIYRRRSHKKRMPKKGRETVAINV